MSLHTRQWHVGLEGADRADAPAIDDADLRKVAQEAAADGLHLLIALGDVRHFRGAQGQDDPHGCSVGRLQALLAAHAPGVPLVGCSTAGEIVERSVHTGTLVITGLRLSGARPTVLSRRIPLMEDSEEVGTAAVQALRDTVGGEPLRHLWVLAPGVEVNGSALVNGLRKGFAGTVLPGISGGLAGDGGAFKRTYTVGPAGVQVDHVVVVGFSGSRVVAGSCASGGWEPFGPVRRITAARGNRLDEMDHEPALTIYRRYLGEYAKDLPASALLFPLQVTGGPDNGLIRTILGIDEAVGGLILAGDVEVDSHARLMHASPHQLIDAAEQIATRLDLPASGTPQPDESPGLALLVSCVGRRIVMGDLTDEEVEAVAEGLPQHSRITGFYSNGEIAAWNFSADCRLHNQTMTITWLTESPPA